MFLVITVMKSVQGPILSHMREQKRGTYKVMNENQVCIFTQLSVKSWWQKTLIPETQKQLC